MRVFTYEAEICRNKHTFKVLAEAYKEEDERGRVDYFIGFYRVWLIGVWTNKTRRVKITLFPNEINEVYRQIKVEEERIKKYYTEV